jgi:hypothetical protein
MEQYMTTLKKQNKELNELLKTRFNVPEKELEKYHTETMHTKKAKKVEQCIALLQTMTTDFFECVLDSMDLTDKFALASTCKEIRNTLSMFFDDWDLKLAELVAKQIDTSRNNKTYKMKEYGNLQVSAFHRRWLWPTTEKIDENPLMVYEYNGGGCYAYEHGHVSADVNYELKSIKDPTWENDHQGKSVFRAEPKLSNTKFDDLKTTMDIPGVKYNWNVHHDTKEPGVGYFLGDPVTTYGENQVTYVRTHNVVSLQITTINPRINIEAMGVAMLDWENYKGPDVTSRCRMHINMNQLRLYVSKTMLL